MGGIRRNRNRRPRNRPQNDKAEGGQNENKDERKPYKEILRENEDFIKYYKAQNLMSDEEWPVFLETMRSDLPTAFRISGSSKAEASRLLEIVKGEFFESLLNPVGENSDNAQLPDAQKPFSLPWYPDGLGWQVKISRKDIRRSEAFFRLHNFLMQETSCGAISRQETVSMIPPIVLDVRPNHKVLDMCAAPGSKTAQLIELLHSGGVGIPEGFVIANDVDNSRCYMLVHQAKRLNSPCIAITNHEAGAMPNLTIEKDGTSSIVKFDRVLCDVPCSGDGTLRKNPDIWPKWNAANANNLHGVQYRIVKRGLEMLEIGGCLVYSTCSLNPVENEAVVARILNEAGDSVELVDITDRLPGLKFERGLSLWKPAAKDLTLYTDYNQVEEKWQTQVRPSMFPPSPESNTVPLEKCVRILPQRQDTGGFFVAAIMKKKLLPWESSSNVSEGVSDKQPYNPPDPPKKKRKTFHGYKEDPYVFFNSQEPIWESIKEFYNISDDMDSTCLLTRCHFGKKKNIYFVSPNLKSTIVSNQPSVKIINTGVKVFSRCDNKSMTCCFRLVQEGLESIKHFIGKSRRLNLPKEEMIKILYMTDPANPLDIQQLSENTIKRIEEISPGSCVLEYYGGENDNDLSVTVVGWRGVRSIRAYIPLSDAIHYLRLLGASVEKFEVNKFKKEIPEKEDNNDDKNGEENVESEEIIEGRNGAEEIIEERNGD